MRSTSGTCTAQKRSRKRGRNTKPINTPHPDTKLPFNEVCCHTPRRVDASTIYRWAMKGKNGVRLRYWRYGRALYTTLAAIDEFAAAVATEDQRLRDSAA